MIIREKGNINQMLTLYLKQFSIVRRKKGAAQRFSGIFVAKYRTTFLTGPKMFKNLNKYGLFRFMK